MANTYTYYPEYRETSLKVAIDDYPIDTPTGFKYCFYLEDGVIKRCPQGQAGISNYENYFGTKFISSINSIYNTYSQNVLWITEHYFTKPLEITGLVKPVITELPNTGQRYWSRLKTLATDGSRVLQLFFGIDRQSYSVFAGFYMCWIENGSVPGNVSFDVTICSLDPRISGETIENIISEINTVLSGSRIYITPNVRLYNPSSTSSPTNRQITTSDTIGLLVEFDGAYAYNYGFGNSTMSSYSALNVASESIVVPTPPTPPEPSGDPYNSGGYSGSGGGPNSGGTGTTGTGGLYDDTSDAIPTPSLPSDVTISSGLFTAYNPDASQLASFANALWNMQVSDINDVLRFLFGGDALNAVVGLHLLPVAPSTGGSQNIKLGNWDTNVSAPKISSQYVQVPFGSLLLPEYWGNCIDYAPYTKIQLALPYIGIVDVDTDDVLGSTNTLTYNIDVLSGAICATLHCVKFNLSSVIYQWSGACAVSLPFSGASYNSVLSAIAGIAAAGMGFAAMAAGPIGAALPAAALAAGAGAFGAGSAASIMGSMKGKVQKSGAFGANSGALGIMTPYFILTRPVQSVPASWQADKGYPANISAQLGTVTGYTEVSEINLECSGTEAEKEEIIRLLKSGVIF